MFPAPIVSDPKAERVLRQVGPVAGFGHGCACKNVRCGGPLFGLGHAAARVDRFPDPLENPFVHVCCARMAAYGQIHLGILYWDTRPQPPMSDLFVDAIIFNPPRLFLLQNRILYLFTRK